MATMDIARAMSGTNPAFLPVNYGFDDLAAYEEERRRRLGQQFQDRIGQLKTGIQSEYDKTLGNYKTGTAQRRSELANSLSSSGQKFFQQNNPYILEDLNARGLLSSPTTLADSQAEALKEIELGNQQRLTDFDATSRTYEDQLGSQRLRDLQELDAAGTQAGIQSEQDALDSALDLRRGSLEKSLQDAQASREEALARDLAKQQGRNQLTSSLIGLGGQLGGAYLGAKMLGGGGNGTGGGIFGNLFGGGINRFGTTGGQIGPQTASQAGFRFGPGGTLLNTSGTSGIGLGSVGGGLLGYELGRTAFKPTQEGDRGAQNVGAAIGGTAGSIFGPAGSAIGSFLGSASGKAQNRIQQGVKKSLGGTAGSIAKYAMPTTAIASVGNKISKAFCFDPETPIMMEDGHQVPINRLYLGAETKGGIVESIRTSKTEDRYIYKGVKVTGSHAVFEDGKWIRVEDSPHAGKVKGEGVVYSIVTDRHRIYINGLTFADEHEVDGYEHMTIDQTLEELNFQEKAAV